MRVFLNRFKHKEATKSESYYFASQWQLMRKKFFKNKLALIGLIVLSILYLNVIFCEFFALFDPYERDTQRLYHPTQLVRVMDLDGNLSWPFVYGTTSTINMENLSRTYEIDEDQKHHLGFFVKGDSYRLWGIIPADRHFFGVRNASGDNSEGEIVRFYLFGTDSLGRDMLSRVIYALRISLTIGLIGVVFEQTFVNTTRTALNNHTQFSSAIASIPTFTTQFSPNPISQSFQMVAKTIAARQSLGFKRQTFFILFGGWDHHDEVLNNQLAMLSVISKGLREFYDVLVELGVQNKVTTFTASDFGRTLSSNGRGSDHAWGGNHMVMGGDVKGGQIYGNYPNLYVDNPLDVGRGSLIPTISCDEYFAELADWFGVARSDLSSVFPNIGRFYDTSARNLPVGFMNRHTVPSDTPSTTPTPTATPLPGTVQTPEPTEVPKPEEPLELPDKTHLPLIKNASGPLFPTTTGIIALTAGAVALRKRRTNG